MPCLGDRTRLPADPAQQQTGVKATKALWRDGWASHLTKGWHAHLTESFGQVSDVPSLTRTAAIIVVGDEILSGKVGDTCSQFLCQELHGIGWQVAKVSFCCFSARACLVVIAD